MIITFPPNQPLTNPPHRYKQGNNTHKKTTCLQINVTSNQNYFFPHFLTFRHHYSYTARIPTRTHRFRLNRKTHTNISP
nr:MAG TPA: hypothetical protein [Bacteriophage sp.]